MRATSCWNRSRLSTTRLFLIVLVYQFKDPRAQKEKVLHSLDKLTIHIVRYTL